METEIDGGVLFYRTVRGRRRWLVLKRREGWLDLPKGHVEKGESLEEAALREAFEEVHLHAKLDPFFAYSYSYKVKGRPKTVHLFLANSYSGKVKVSKEHTGYLWLKEGEEQKLSYSNMREAIEYAREYIKKRKLIEGINYRYAKLAESKTWSLSRRFVPGYGNVNAKIMIIGQAPGAQEDVLLRPFVGRSGKLLDKLLELAGSDNKPKDYSASW